MNLLLVVGHRVSRAGISVVGAGCPCFTAPLLPAELSDTAVCLSVCLSVEQFVACMWF
jgi:hypothetical protein